MKNKVIFEDYSIKVKDIIKEKAISFLREVAGEIRSLAQKKSRRTQRKSRRKVSQTAGSYQYKVDSERLAAYVGSNYWNAIYEEFGTGEHALNGDGRKGYWVYVDSGGEPKAPKGGKTLTLKEAKRAVAIMRAKGLKAYYTNGKEANRPLYKAFTETKPKAIKQAEKTFGELGK